MLSSWLAKPLAIRDGACPGGLSPTNLRGFCLARARASSFPSRTNPSLAHSSPNPLRGSLLSNWFHHQLQGTCTNPAAFSTSSAFPKHMKGVMVTALTPVPAPGDAARSTTRRAGNCALPSRNLLKHSCVFQPELVPVTNPLASIFHQCFLPELTGLRAPKGAGAPGLGTLGSGAAAGQRRSGERIG